MHCCGSPACTTTCCGNGPRLERLAVTCTPSDDEPMNPNAKAGKRGPAIFNHHKSHRWIRQIHLWIGAWGALDRKSVV